MDRSKLATASLIALALGMPSLASAQNADNQSEEAGADQSASEGSEFGGEIVVTAQKREQRLQDVPMTAAAFTGDTLADMGVADTTQLGELIPGLELFTPNGEGSQAVIFLRGAGLNDFNSNNAGPVGIYADDVYISSPALTAFQFFDTERLEVLKGPQGTLYGRNSTGGAVKFISNKPTDMLEVLANVSYATFDTVDAEAAISGPLSDSVKARAAVNYSRSDGFIDNAFTGGTAGGHEIFSYRGLLELDPVDTVNILLNVHGSHVDSPVAGQHPQGVLDGSGVPCTPAQIVQNICGDALGYVAPDDPFDGSFNVLGGTNLDAIGGSATIRIELGEVTLTSVSAYDEVDRQLAEDSDGSPNRLIEITYDVESETFAQELRLTGGGDTFDWLIGGYYLSEELNQDQTVDLFGSLRPLTGGLSDPMGTVAGAPILFARTLNQQEIETFAIFGQVTVELLPDFNVTGGLRYTDEERSFSGLLQLEDQTVFGPDNFVIYDEPNLQYQDDAFSWRVALDYRVNPDLLVYSSVARGFKSGGFNGGFLSLDAAASLLQLEPYDSEFLTAYEAGFKSDLVGGLVRFNAAVFLNKFSDVQVFTLVNTGALPVQVLDNASDAEVFGIEFETTITPIDGLFLSLNGAYMDSELKDFQTDQGDFSGNRIANTPEFSLGGMARYEFDVGSDGELAIQGNFARQSSIFFSTENNPLLAQDGYTLVNGRIEYTGANGQWSIAAFANNIFDTEYNTLKVDLTDFGFISRLPGRPRVIGVEAGFRY